LVVCSSITKWGGGIKERAPAWNMYISGKSFKQRVQRNIDHRIAPPATVGAKHGPAAVIKGTPR
jgi:hypothetical protein